MRKLQVDVSLAGPACLSGTSCVGHNQAAQGPGGGSGEQQRCYKPFGDLQREAGGQHGSGGLQGESYIEKPVMATPGRSFEVTEEPCILGEWLGQSPAGHLTPTLLTHAHIIWKLQESPFFL